MGVFHLKQRDTRPSLQVVLKNPDGTLFDHTGSSAWKLHIWLAVGSKLVRTMVRVGGAPALGDPDNRPLLYEWVSTDWDAPSSPDGNGSFTVGGLVVGPALPLTPGTREHRIEYEVTGGAARMTFPNDGYDTLRILQDIGQS